MLRLTPTFNVKDTQFKVILRSEDALIACIAITYRSYVKIIVGVLITNVIRTHSVLS